MTTATKTNELIETGTYVADQPHSSASFEVEHSGIAFFRGGFKPLEAKLVATEDGLELEGRVAVEAISIDDENIRPHLLSPDFFDVERNSEVSFRSTEISGDADGLRVVGELSLAGTTRGVEAHGRLRGPVEGPGGVEKVSLALEAAIDRTDYGMNWQMELPAGGQALANEVKLVVELELNREE